MAHSLSVFTMDESQLLSQVNEQVKSSQKYGYTIIYQIEQLERGYVVNSGSLISKVPEKVSLESSQCLMCKR